MMDAPNDHDHLSAPGSPTSLSSLATPPALGSLATTPRHVVDDEQDNDDLVHASPLSSKRARETSVDSDADSLAAPAGRSGSASPLGRLDDDDDDGNDGDNDARALFMDDGVPDLLPEEQVGYIQPLKDSAMVSDEIWYLLPSDWYDRWQKYCTRLASPNATTRQLGRSTEPGPIDTTSLLMNDGRQLLPDLVYDQDYVLVPERAWRALEKWYTCPSTPIARTVVRQGGPNDTVVEVYPPTFKLYVIAESMSTLEKPPILTLSRTTPMHDLRNAITDALDLSLGTPFHLYRLENDPLIASPFIAWSSIPQDTAERLTLDQNDDKSISDMALASSILLIDVDGARSSNNNNNNNNQANANHANGNASDTSSTSTNSSSIFGNTFHNLTTASSPPFSSSSTFASNHDMNWKASSPTTASSTVPPHRQRGTTGLSNLGNTCFMNSALQCLSNTEELTNWFLAGNYKNDLNRDNPLGMGGQIAENYGNLIEKLWSGTLSHVPPREFKQTISRFNPTFTGYQQHDSQELLAFLLDGLHEDLNRILKKPYIEMPDFDDKPDDEVAKTSWNYHKARNDSIIVDLFQGQFKSRLVCNVCEKVSVTFDPFMYLSLPLPIQKKRKTTVTYVPYDPSQHPKRMVITLDKDASISHLKSAVAKQMGVHDASTLLVGEIFSNKLYKVLPDYDMVSNIQMNDIIYVYQLPGPMPAAPPASTRRSRLRFNSSRFLSDDEHDDEHEKGSKAHDAAPFDGEKWLVFPVYCAVTPDAPETEDQDQNDPTSPVSFRRASFSRPSMSQFGSLMVLAIQAKDATSPEAIYTMIAKQVERYAIVKLFEEDKQSARQQEQANDDDDAMDVDPSSPRSPHSPHNPLIRTAAAVTAAGGRQLRPIQNLFTIKVCEPGYPEDLIPAGLSPIQPDSMIDLKERYEKEQKQQREYDQWLEEQKQQEQDSHGDNGDAMQLDASSTSPVSMSPEDEKDEKVDDDDTDYEDEVVGDASAAYTPDAPKSMIIEPPAKPAAAFGASSSVSSTLLASEKPKTTRPPRPAPHTIIRQGEGIVIAWTQKRAQEIFGAKSSSSSESSRGGGITLGNSHQALVNDDAWNDIENLGDPLAAAEAAEKGRNKQVTLMDCLDEFTKEEELSEEDLWYCPRCKEHQRATKKFDIWHLPDILVVHLKRFSHTRTLRDKIDALIDFPLESLDLTDRVLGVNDDPHPNDRYIYDLYAVDNHFGGMGGGHYTAYGRNFMDGHWYNFDDSHVTKVDQSDAKTSAAYLLFYKRRRQGQTTQDTASPATEDDAFSAAAVDIAIDANVPDELDEMA
ncbi:hypothetical protein BC940DRAFT_248979 [Gongronella butleri]|nr:hypothetical protein BC940DRAFT_248979 [Gongronella butleri]